MSQFHIQQILGFGPDPLPPFGTMSLNPVFFILKASLSLSFGWIIISSLDDNQNSKDCLSYFRTNSLLTENPTNKALSPKICTQSFPILSLILCSRKVVFDDLAKVGFRGLVTIDRKNCSKRPIRNISLVYPHISVC